MEQKKNIKADLEKKRVVFLELGLVLVLAIVLLAFEWGTALQENDLLEQTNVEVLDEEVIVTRQQETQPPPPPPPQVIEEFLVFEDEDQLEETEFDFSTEVDVNDALELTFFEEEEEAAEEEVFVIVEDMPQFKGGDINKFREWVSTRLRYPDIAAENGISGKVFIQFAVNASGEVVDVAVVRSVDPALDEEAKRVVMSSPKWNPGKQRGRPVKVQFTIPVNFQLQ